MRKMVLLLLIVLIGCTSQRTVSNQDLLLNDQDLKQLNMTGSGCTTESYQTGPDSPFMQYSMCNYTIKKMNTEVIVELRSFANTTELNYSYQYDSLHLYSIEGLISENTFGDQSRFRVSDVHDYGGQFNDPNVTYYHLWICKDNYLIHITSKGSKDAQATIANTGQLILAKF